MKARKPRLPIQLPKVVNDSRDITFNCVYTIFRCDCYRKRLMTKNVRKNKRKKDDEKKTNGFLFLFFSDRLFF